MDDISCLINEAPVGGGGVDKLGMESSMQDVLTRMKLLEEQMAACLQAQPLLYQVFGKCNALEERIKTIKEEIDGKLDELTKTPAPVSEDQESSHLNRAEEPVVRSPETENTNAADADSDSDWQPPNSDGEQNEEDPEDSDGGDALELPEDASMSCDIGDDQMDTGQLYVCKVCFPKVEFDDAEALANHYTSCHSITETNIAVNRKSDRTRKRKDRSPNETSSRSERKNGKKPNLEGNMDADGDLSSRTCPKCRRTFQTPSHMTQHLASDHPAIFCDRCDLEFTNKTNLAAHKKAVHRKKDPPKHNLPIPCPDGCGKITPNRSALLKHIRRCRQVQLPYQCDKCEVKYIDARSLLAHKVRVHGHVMSEKQQQAAALRKHRSGLYYYCETCGIGFGTSSHLKTHHRKHTGEKPFACEYCNMAFRDNNTLKQHTLLHTGKPFVCDECGWAFVKMYLLRNHKEAHRRGTIWPKRAASGHKYAASTSGAVVTGVASTGAKSAKPTVS